MKKKLMLLGSILILAVVLILTQTGNEEKITYPGVTRDNMAEIIVPAAENEGIYTDITGFITGEKVVLFLPCRANKKNVVFYVRDAMHNILDRFEIDFSKGDFLLEGVPVVCMQSDLPSLEIVTDAGITGNDSNASNCNVNYDADAKKVQNTSSEQSVTTSYESAYAAMKAVEKDKQHNTKAYGSMTLSCSEKYAAENQCERVITSEENEENLAGSMYIKGRGNMSWKMDKKGFLIRLEKKEKLLGMPKAKKWVLVANTIDHSLVRNQTMLKLSKECGCLYTSDIKPVDLFINGEYRGNYSLCTKVEVGVDRVDIDENNDYLYRLGIMSGNYRMLSMNSLSGEDACVELVSGQNEEEAFEIFQRIITELEDIGSAKLFEDIDIESWARYYWVQEIGKNTDATLRSVYFYWDHDEEKMYMISPWDFDRTVGSAEQFGKEELRFLMPDGWTVRKDNWYVPLFEHPEFEAEVKRVYFEGGIRKALLGISRQAAGYVDEVSISAQMNFVRWDHLNQPLDGYYNEIAKYMGDSSYKSETEWLVEWLRQRAEWIDTEMKSE